MSSATVAISVRVDAASALNALRKGEKRFAYAVSNAINNTALEVQRAMRDRVSRVFTLRRKGFLLRMAAVISPFAKPVAGQLRARIMVGEAPRLLLSGYEDGALRRPVVGRHVAMAIVGGPARRTLAASWPKRYRFDALGLHRVGRSIRGTSRTYVVPGVGVYQRRGPNATEKVISFRPEFRLDRRLGFVATGRALVAARFRPELEAQVRSSLAFNGRR